MTNYPAFQCLETILHGNSGADLGFLEKGAQKYKGRFGLLSLSYFS